MEKQVVRHFGRFVGRPILSQDGRPEGNFHLGSGLDQRERARSRIRYVGSFAGASSKTTAWGVRARFVKCQWLLSTSPQRHDSMVVRSSAFRKPNAGSEGSDFGMAGFVVCLSLELSWPWVFLLNSHLTTFVCASPTPLAFRDIEYEFGGRQIRIWGHVSRLFHCEFGEI